jgi:DNA end-binding protein Ku
MIMPPRALWTGTISFGLVNVPIRLYPAVSEHTLHFKLVHERDGGAIGYQKVCKAEDKPVPDDEIVKAFEVKKGELVPLTDEDFESVRVEGMRTIEISDFVPEDEIDPLFFARSMYVGAQEGGEKVYALLVRAMEEAGLAAIARFVMRERQHIGCLRVHDGALVLEQLHFADEIRPIDEVRPKAIKVDPKELKMARQLIDAFAGSFDPEKYRDTYRDALMKVIKAKQSGKEVVHAAEEEREPTTTDLMEALRASIEASKGGGATRKSAPRAKAAPKRKAAAKTRSRSRARS